MLAAANVEGANAPCQRHLRTEVSGWRHGLRAEGPERDKLCLYSGDSVPRSWQ
jgi:methyl coenzyme M reductase subunit C